MELVVLFFAVLGAGVVLTIAGYDARYRLPLELRAHTGLARLSIGIFLTAIAIGGALSALGYVIHKLASV